MERAERTRHRVFTDEHDGGGPDGDEGDWHQQFGQDASVESAGGGGLVSPRLVSQCHGVCVTVFAVAPEEQIRG